MLNESGLGRRQTLALSMTVVGKPAKFATSIPNECCEHPGWAESSKKCVVCVCV